LVLRRGKRRRREEREDARKRPDRIAKFMWKGFTELVVCLIQGSPNGRRARRRQQ